MQRRTPGAAAGVQPAGELQRAHPGAAAKADRVGAGADLGAAQDRRGSPSSAISSHVRRDVGHHFVRKVSDPRGTLPASGTPSRGGHLSERGAGLPGHQ